MITAATQLEEATTIEAAIKTVVEAATLAIENAKEAAMEAATSAIETAKEVAIEAVEAATSAIETAKGAAIEAVEAAKVLESAEELVVLAPPEFEGIGGAILVALIAFSVVFLVLIGLFALLKANRYLAMIVEKKDTMEKAAPSVAAPVSAPVSQTSDAKDMKKVIAVISAAINASVGGGMNIISVTPTRGNCSDMNKMWRVTGVAECMASRLGTGPWSR